MIQLQGFFWSSLVGVFTQGSTFQAYCRSEEMVHIGTQRWKGEEDAIEEAKLKACEWECYNRKEPTILVGCDGKILAANGSARASFGYQEEDYLPQITEGQQTIDVNGAIALVLPQTKQSFFFVASSLVAA